LGTCEIDVANFFMDSCEHRYVVKSRFIGKKSITDVSYCQVVLDKLWCLGLAQNFVFE